MISNWNYGGSNRIVGFAVLVEVNGEKMLIYSDSVDEGRFTLYTDRGPVLESDDGIIMEMTRMTWYDVRLSGYSMNFRREGRKIEDLLLPDHNVVKQIEEKMKNIEENREKKEDIEKDRGGPEAAGPDDWGYVGDWEKGGEDE